jgi:hypothetical protein
MMSPDQETPDIYPPCLPTLLTISRSFNTPCSPLLLHYVPLDDRFNPPDTCLEYQVFYIHHSIIDQHKTQKMSCDDFWLPKSVVADANTIQISTLHVYVWPKNASVGVSQWAAETIRIWQDIGGFTLQWIDNKVRERIWEVALTMSIINRQGAGPEQ